jgi:fructokinase
MKYRIVAIGEVLWDLLPEGKQLGGAPANFIYHAHALGADASLVTRVGDDALGRDILERLNQLGLPTNTVQIDTGVPTGIVSVELAPGGKPSYLIHENVAWDQLSADETALAAVRRADALYFGTLAQRGEHARRTIHTLITAASTKALRILDLNLRAPFVSREVVEASLASTGVLKMSDEELPVLAKMIGLNGDARQQFTELARRYGLSVVALTRGSRGSLLWRDGGWSDHPGLTTAVRDTVGAGDAFSAVLTLGVLAGRALDEINARANEVAAYVCSQPGATPALPFEMRSTFA